MIGRSSVTTTTTIISEPNPTKVSYVLRGVDKLIVAESTIRFTDTPEITHNGRNVVSDFFEKRIQYQITLDAVCQYYVNLGNFDLTIENGSAYVYVNPLILNEPVGYYNQQVKELAVGGWLVVSSKERLEKLNDEYFNSGKLQEKLTENGKLELNNAQIVAKESIAKNNGKPNFSPYWRYKHQRSVKSYCKIRTTPARNSKKFGRNYIRNAQELGIYSARNTQ